MPDDKRKENIYVENHSIFTREPPGNFMFAFPSHRSDNHRIIRHIGVLAAKMFNFILIVVSEIVKSQTVLFCIHDSEKFGLQHFALRSIQFALEN